MFITLLIAILLVAALICWFTNRRKQAKVLAVAALAVLAFVVAGANIGSSGNDGQQSHTTGGP